MKNPHSLFNRRGFIKRSSIATGGLMFYGAAARYKAAEPPSERMIIGVMGLQRGLDLVNSSLALPNVEVAYVCDIDDDRIARGQKVVAGKQKQREVKGEKDIRKVLEDKEVDAIFVAAPNHWHAPATIMGCAAGKHVYVEKPCSHNPWEGEAMVSAARKHSRVVQMGNQRRSWPALIEAMEKLNSGVIGKPLYARSWYNNARGTIGKGKPAPVPAKFDYELWQGPAPERPYKDNLVHYNWHWHWHWGNGELGNNGIHALDVARWGLGVSYPKTVSCTGGRYHFDDDQETPDTAQAVYDFGGKGASWDGSSCHPRQNEQLAFVTFYGEKGSLANIGGGYKIFDLKGKEIDQGTGEGGEKLHIQNFFDCIKNGKRPNSDIAEGHVSTMLCHLGNIAWRTGRTLKINQSTGEILNDEEAMSHWKREYRPGWEPRW
ncbi:MAG: Gfo/Idh/MocA family protein [Verrucomicrobiales bacterium]